jgi:hypothetical protein
MGVDEREEGVLGERGFSRFQGFLLSSVPSWGGDETNVAFLAAVRGCDICEIGYLDPSHKQNVQVCMGS